MALPRVGVAVIVMKDGKILLGKRKGHGDGLWSVPGGHLEFNETIIDCAIREIKEETGLEIHNLKEGPCVENIQKDGGTHYINIFVIADWASGEAQNLEPDKCTGWEWFSWDDLPEPLFPSIQRLKESGFRPQ